MLRLSRALSSLAIADIAVIVLMRPSLEQVKAVYLFFVLISGLLLTSIILFLSVLVSISYAYILSVSLLARFSVSAWYQIELYAKRDFLQNDVERQRWWVHPWRTSVLLLNKSSIWLSSSTTLIELLYSASVTYIRPSMMLNFCITCQSPSHHSLSKPFLKSIKLWYFGTISQSPRRQTVGRCEV